MIELRRMPRAAAAALLLTAAACTSVPAGLEVFVARGPTACVLAVGIHSADARGLQNPGVIGGRVHADGTLDAPVRLLGFATVSTLLEHLAQEVLCEARTSPEGLRPLPEPGQGLTLVVEEFSLTDDGDSLRFHARVAIDGDVPAEWLGPVEVDLRQDAPSLRASAWAAALDAGLERWADALRARWSPGTVGRELVAVELFRR